MTDILFPSRLSDVNTYHSLIMCCIVTNNSCIKKQIIGIMRNLGVLQVWPLVAKCTLEIA